MEALAKTAVIAAKHARQWGQYAAMRYARKRGCSALMICIAFNFEEKRRTK